MASGEHRLARSAVPAEGCGTLRSRGVEGGLAASSDGLRRLRSACPAGRALRRLRSVLPRRSAPGALFGTPSKYYFDGNPFTGGLA